VVQQAKQQNWLKAIDFGCSQQLPGAVLSTLLKESHVPLSLKMC
jgi:hypothetical protein